MRGISLGLGVHLEVDVGKSVGLVVAIITRDSPF